MSDRMCHTAAAAQRGAARFWRIMKPLSAVPPSLVETRLALHRLAAYVIAPARYRQTERFGLRATNGGFGTPVFGERRIRVAGLELIDEVGQDRRTAAITSLAAAAEFLGETVDPDTAAEHDSPAVGDQDADLGIDEASSNWLGEWFNVTFDALNIVREDPASNDASEVQLWPGHFDPAIEMGDENHRGSYGASPGDDGIAEPYIYLSIWWPDRLNLDTEDPFWNAPSFTGAVLRVSDFPADTDPVDVAVEFWRTARDLVDQS